MEREKDALWFTIGCDPSLMKYIVPKGYIAVDGTSLTVCDVYDDAFTFTMIPFTQDHVRSMHPALLSPCGTPFLSLCSPPVDDTNT